MGLLEFSHQLAAVITLKEAENCLESYLKSYRFKFYAFTYYAGHIRSGRKLRYHCVSKALLPWHAHYLEQAYTDVDRTLEEIHLLTLPFLWDVQTQLAQAKNKRERRIRLESIEFGIDKGLSIPVHGPDHDFASLSLHQCRNETCLSDYLTQQFIWMSAAQLYYHHIRRILLNDKEQTSIDYGLTTREEQCLTLTAKSFRVEQIAKTLKISPRTVNFHLQNANKKLGTHNKYQAINKYFK
jgi:DNA-binding CsgD family transcriptional regulator